ncbi:MAG: hypothetical protein ACOC7R_02150 [Planctomycetota bacterium]
MIASWMKQIVGRWMQVVMHLIRCLLGAGALAGWVLLHLLTPFMAAPWLHSLDALPAQAADVPDGLGQWTGMITALSTGAHPRCPAGWFARGHAGEPTGLHPGPGPPGYAGAGFPTPMDARAPPFLP